MDAIIWVTLVAFCPVKWSMVEIVTNMITYESGVPRYLRSIYFQLVLGW